MKALRLASAFRRDLKRIERRGCNRVLLEALVTLYAAERNCPGLGAIIS
jgi:hypothetical protein